MKTKAFGFAESSAREFCWSCHRSQIACFCKQVRLFASDAQFALVVHPYEAKSTVGTAWIMRRSISNLKWFRSKGKDLDTDPRFLEMIDSPEVVPLLLFPRKDALNLNRASDEQWRIKVPESRRPLFIVIDGTWTQAKQMLKESSLLSSLPCVSFETAQLSEYGFKKQPNPHCLSSVEGVHRVIEVLAERNWAALPSLREHDQMIEIFRGMVRFQLQMETNPKTGAWLTRRSD